MDKKCKVCGSNDLEKVLDLGVMPSANNLVEQSELNNVDSFPLVYYVCKKCTLFQQVELRSGRSLFTNYVYLTGVNKGLVEHFKEMSKELRGISKFAERAYVVGSNDGSEVELLSKSGFKQTIGVEPSNIHELSASRGFETVHAFFNYSLSTELVEKYGKADLITANNIFAHIEDPIDMLKGMGNLINDTGIISIEVHWIKSIIDKLEIETLYAEHYFVWSIKAMEYLTSILGLRISDVKYMPNQHGGSVRFIITKNEIAETLMEPKQKRNSRIKELRYEEPVLSAYSELQKRAIQRKDNFSLLIHKLKKEGKRVSIWSVPAKVPTLINFCELTNKDIECAYEVAKTKIGKYIPKANIPIKDEKLIMEDRPDYLIIGAWNYIDIAKEKLSDYMKAGGILINPLTCEIIGAR